MRCRVVIMRPLPLEFVHPPELGKRLIKVNSIKENFNTRISK